MSGYYDPRARETDIDMGGHETDERRHGDRRETADRRKKDRRKKSARAAGGGLLQPILTQAEIAALLKGAR